MKIVIVADGDVNVTALRRAAAAGGDERGPIVLAADGGALKAEAAGLPVDLVLGDGDSLDDAAQGRLREAGTRVRLVAPEKDLSDMELCLREALALGATSVRIHGALGGTRPEHSLANLALLALPELAGLDVSVEHGASVIRLFGSAEGPGAIELSGEIEDFVSLLPLSPGAQGVTTQGLRYPLDDEDLTYGPSRGLSNEFLQARARVTVRRGRLLVTQSQRRGSIT